MGRKTSLTITVALVLAAGGGLSSCRSANPPGLAQVERNTAPVCQVARVVDGDTVDLSCRGTGQVRARLTGYDTPETFEPGCAAEAQAGRAATTRLDALVAQSRVSQTKFEGVDRFGRSLVRLSLDGRDVAALLIAEGLAVPYSGGPRIDWCNRLG